MELPECSDGSSTSKQQQQQQRRALKEVGETSAGLDALRACALRAVQVPNAPTRSSEIIQRIFSGARGIFDDVDLYAIYVGVF